MDLKERAKQLKRDIPAVFLCMKSHETPIAAKNWMGSRLDMLYRPLT